MSSWVYRTRDVFATMKQMNGSFLMEWHLRVIGGLAAKLSRVFSSHMREVVKQTHSIIFMNDGRLMCLQFTRWFWWQRFGISIGASQAFMGRMIVLQRGATKILGWGEDPPPSSPGGWCLVLSRWDGASASWRGLQDACCGVGYDGIPCHTEPLPSMLLWDMEQISYLTLNTNFVSKSHGQTSRPFSFSQSPLWK